MAQSCLMGECLAAEMGAALGLQAAECGAASLKPTGSATATSPFLPSNSASDISGAPSAASSSGSSSTGSKGSAVSLVSGMGVGAAAFVAAVGGLVGGLVLL